MHAAAPPGRRRRPLRARYASPGRAGRPRAAPRSRHTRSSPPARDRMVSSRTTAAGIKSTRLASMPGSSARSSASSASTRWRSQATWSARRAGAVQPAERRRRGRPAPCPPACSPCPTSRSPARRRRGAPRRGDRPSSCVEMRSSARTWPADGGSLVRNCCVRRATPSGRLRIQSGRPSSRERQLDAAAADVDEQVRATVETQRVPGRRGRSAAPPPDPR